MIEGLTLSAKIAPVMTRQEKRPRPFQDVGRFVRRARERQGVTQLAAAAAAPMRNELLSRLERGENVEIAAYALAAKGLGFRSVIDLFRSGGDRQTARLLRLWAALPDDEARKDVLERVRRTVDDDEAPSATSPARRDDGRTR